MAFSIPGYTAPNGSTGLYFVISSIQTKALSGSITVGVSGYINQAAIASGMQPVVTEFFKISGASFTAFLAQVTAQDIPAGSAISVLQAAMTLALENELLTLPFFANATIVS